MRKLIITTGLIFMLHPAFAGRGAEITGLSTNLFVNAAPIKHNVSYSQQSAILTCYAYRNFAVTELDTGDQGATKISIRYADSNHSPATLCEKKFAGKETNLTDANGYFEGVIDNYVFTSSADSFGGFMHLTIYEAMTGKKVFQTDYNLNKKLYIRRENQRLSLIYYQLIQLNCLPSDKNKACWKTFLEKNMIKNVSVPAPDCQGTSDADAVQISVKVMVNNLGKPSLVYLPARPTCDLKP